MSNPKRLQQLLTEHKQSLENLARSTTIGRPLSPMHIKEVLDGTVAQVARIMAEFGEAPAPAAFNPAPPAAEAKKGSKPPDGKPV